MYIFMLFDQQLRPLFFDIDFYRSLPAPFFVRTTANNMYKTHKTIKVSLKDKKVLTNRNNGCIIVVSCH